MDTVLYSVGLTEVDVLEASIDTGCLRLERYFGAVAYAL